MKLQLVFSMLALGACSNMFAQENPNLFFMAGEDNTPVSNEQKMAELKAYHAKVKEFHRNNLWGSIAIGLDAIQSGVNAANAQKAKNDAAAEEFRRNNPTQAELAARNQSQSSNNVDMSSTAQTTRSATSYNGNSASDAELQNRAARIASNSSDPTMRQKAYEVLKSNPNLTNSQVLQMITGAGASQQTSSPAQAQNPSTTINAVCLINGVKSVVQLGVNVEGYIVAYSFGRDQTGRTNWNTSYPTRPGATNQMVDGDMARDYKKVATVGVGNQSFRAYFN